MKHIIVNYLPLLISCLTIFMMWQAGNRKRLGWLFGTGCQALWLVFILTTQTWGLIPLNVAMWFITIRNYRKWSTE
jgi:hypothetical protein